MDNIKHKHHHHHKHKEEKKEKEKDLKKQPIIIKKKNKTNVNEIFTPNPKYLNYISNIEIENIKNKNTEIFKKYLMYYTIIHDYAIKHELPTNEIEILIKHYENSDLDNNIEKAKIDRYEIQKIIKPIDEKTFQTNINLSASEEDKCNITEDPNLVLFSESKIFYKNQKYLDKPKNVDSKIFKYKKLPSL